MIQNCFRISSIHIWLMLLREVFVNSTSVDPLWLQTKKMS